MQRFKNILAAIDTRFEQHPALEWAARLAVHNQSKLKIIDVVPEFSWVARLAMSEHEHTREVLRQEKGRSLEALAAPLHEKGIDVTRLSTRAPVTTLRSLSGRLRLPEESSFASSPSGSQGSPDGLRGGACIPTT